VDRCRGYCPEHCAKQEADESGGANGESEEGGSGIIQNDWRRYSESGVRLYGDWTIRNFVSITAKFHI